MSLPCQKCAGEGRIFESKHGGNDPDVWDAGECPACRGIGHEPCARRRCPDKAVGFNDDGEPLCEDCMADWVVEMSL
jgi:hypothetical protein